MNNSDLFEIPISRLLEERPYIGEFFSAQGLSLPSSSLSLGRYLETLSAAELDELGIHVPTLLRAFEEFVEQMEIFNQAGRSSVSSITLIGGVDKTGEAENVTVELRAGDLVAVVGPTGSGKSRLLEDIESMAQGDTPSKRRILVDGAVPDEALRLSGEQRLVAQLSQNMNFVMDLSVEEFISVHAESRLVEDVAGAVEQVFTTAVDMAGEPFTLDTAVTALSGGQSRALMIADVACLSVSPIVLIDEIENAGVDRRRALDLLVQKEKIVLMATHDPILALMADRRLVIRNGGIHTVIETSEEEREGLDGLNLLDRKLAALRERVRCGEPLDFDLARLLSSED